MKTVKIIFWFLVAIVTMAGIFSIILLPLEQHFGFDIPGIEISAAGLAKIWGFNLTTYGQVFSALLIIVFAMMILFRATLFPKAITLREERLRKP